MSEVLKRANEGAQRVLASTSYRPRIGLILGSGLGAFAESLEDATSTPYAEIPGFVKTTVSGHAGRLVIGRSGDIPVMVMAGRFHAYEGHDLVQVTMPVRVMKQMGVEVLIITNSAGGINAKFPAGTLMLLTDHINMTGNNPLIGPNEDDFGPRFPDQTYVYDPELREQAHAVAAEKGIALQQGVYVGVMGPSYETPAEIRMLRVMGADAVGMSTVPEAIVANHAGMRIVGISCISNPAAGMEPERLDHSDVKATVATVEEQFIDLIRGIIGRADALLNKPSEPA